jgi:hypothetical protein
MFILLIQQADKFTKQLIVYVQNYTEDVSSSHYSADANSFIDSMQQLVSIIHHDVISLQYL